MFRERLIVDDSLVTHGDGYSLRARLPWYRALPLSCVTDVIVSVDGELADPNVVTIETDGFVVLLPQVARAWDRCWFVLDDLEIRVSGISLPDRSEHEVDLIIGLRIPYLPVNGAPLVVREHSTKTMSVKEHVA